MYGPEFEAFWKDMLQRPDSYPKKECHAYWTGFKPLKDGSRISPADWKEIHEGAKAYKALNDREPQYIMNAAKWMYNGQWEGWLEKARHKQEMLDRMDDEDQARVERRDATREYQAAYSAWRLERNLLKSPESEAQFREYMRQKSRLKVVG